MRHTFSGVAMRIFGWKCFCWEWWLSVGSVLKGCWIASACGACIGMFKLCDNQECVSKKAYRELDGVHCGACAQVVAACLKAPLPWVEVHRCELLCGGCCHEQVERLALVDECTAVSSHVDQCPHPAKHMYVRNNFRVEIWNGTRLFLSKKNSQACIGA